MSNWLHSYSRVRLICTHKHDGLQSLTSADMSVRHCLLRNDLLISSDNTCYIAAPEAPFAALPFQRYAVCSYSMYLQRNGSKALCT